ncbi:MAG: hypothetical protein M1839_005612 [Geoglossum umbratile]|nr:MAG: hypothetical protein M1839_005612 [Geoglossum umbratile]
MVFMQKKRSDATQPINNLALALTHRKKCYFSYLIVAAPKTALPPISVLQNVDLLFNQWVQTPYLVAELPGSTISPKAPLEPTSDSGGYGGDNEESATLNNLKDDISLELAEQKYRTDRMLSHESLERIQERLKKQEKGLLEIDERALGRLNNQMAELRQRVIQCDQGLDAYTEHRRD